MAYIRCSAGRTHFAQTKSQICKYTRPFVSQLVRVKTGHCFNHGQQIEALKISAWVDWGKSDWVCTHADRGMNPIGVKGIFWSFQSLCYMSNASTGCFKVQINPFPYLISFIFLRFLVILLGKGYTFLLFDNNLFGLDNSSSIYGFMVGNHRVEFLSKRNFWGEAAILGF